MQVTINLEVLLNVLLLLMTTASLGVLLWLNWKERKLQRKSQQMFGALPDALKTHVRYQTLFLKPLSDHDQTHPKDLRHVLQVVRTKSDEMGTLHMYHSDGMQSMNSWTDGVGLDVAHLLRDAVLQMERGKPGLVRVLQPMLDVVEEDAKHPIK